MPSFDVVSKLNRAELQNAFNQTQRELSQRYDFRGSDSRIEAAAESYTLFSDSDDRVRSAYGVFVEKLAKRDVSIKHFEAQKVEAAAGKERKLVVKVSEGIDRDKAKLILNHLKGAKLKVQASIIEDAIRVSGKKKDDLQAAIAELKAQDFGVELQFTNFRD